MELRPLTLLIAALGGEGGGVLADWIIAAATAEDYPVQSTSIPGVAQRTGATTYYLELYPLRRSELGERQPVMPLAPTACDVDVMLASELLEAGRAIANGYVTPARTTLIASTHRIYTVMEKMQMGDGRYEDERVLNSARALSKRALLADFQALAQQSGTLINAVLFGALAGSGVLPLSRARCEEAIRAGGRGAEASLRGFALGFAAAADKPREPAATEGPQEKQRMDFPAATHAMIATGTARVRDYQDEKYAMLYHERIEAITTLDKQMGGEASGYQLTVETARFLALWMCYEDVIRVADLKSRKSRFERVRAEVQAKAHEPVHIVEYLKPGIEEVAALLPPGLSQRLMAFAERRGLAQKLNVGVHIKSSSISGFLLLRALASLRPLRRRSARYAEEQVLIERWLAAIRAANDASLALEIALCARLIKGYGDTNRRGKANFLRIFETLVEKPNIANAGERAQAVRAVREAALADAEGRTLEKTLSGHGIAPLPPTAKPIKFMRRSVAQKAA